MLPKATAYISFKYVIEVNLQCLSKLMKSFKMETVFIPVDSRAPTTKSTEIAETTMQLL